ncbi:MAG: flippase-like domain-containing protein [Chitinophagales bacterium]|nr:flippase-like domain-containing protein [Chitinophagales bacterium]MDW8417787.1 lysylphosphatidylglycerol synthase domain-containing protein [Chitinophagales bacterium]
MSISWLQRTQKIKAAIFTLASIVLLIYTISDSNLRWSDLRIGKTEAILFFTTVLLLILVICLQAKRFIIPTEGLKVVKTTDSIKSLLLGLLYNSLLPGNIGELIRAWHFSKKNKISYKHGLSLVGLEKYIDALNYILYAAILGLIFGSLAVYRRLFMPVTIIVLFIFILYLLIIHHRQTERIMLRFLSLFENKGMWLFSLHEQLKLYLKSMTLDQYLRYFVIGLIIFIINILQYYLLLQMTSLPAAMRSWDVAYMVSVSMIIVFLIPAAPGSAGVVHGGIYYVLLQIASFKSLPVNVELTSEAAAYTIYLHLSYFIPQVTAGVIVLFKERNVLFYTPDSGFS